jgi:hypothetical protein
MKKRGSKVRLGRRVCETGKNDKKEKIQRRTVTGGRVEGKEK